MSTFKFRKFTIKQVKSAMKVGTDSMLLGALVNSQNKHHGLDIGAGTGVLSLMIAQQNPDIKITACEIDEMSAQECGYNFNVSPWKENLFVFHSDFREVEFDQRFDLIFSNPPYYMTTLRNEDSRISNAKHVVTLVPTVFMSKTSELLCRNGDVWIIIPYADMHVWTTAANKFDLNCNETYTISGKRGAAPNRVVCHFSRKSMESQHFTLTVREQNGDYTEEYKDLTRDFHAVKL